MVSSSNYYHIPAGVGKSVNGIPIFRLTTKAVNLLSVSGIGAIPDAVLAQLGNHRNLGIHSVMFSDGVVELVKKGVITNTEKSILTGRLVSSFSIGTKILYNFLHNNPSVGELEVVILLIFSFSHICKYYPSISTEI